MVNATSNKPEDLQVVEVLQRIKDGSLNPLSLSKESRQLCVEALILEGHQVSSIASLMKKSDRTIRRDVEDIRQRNAIKTSPGFSKMLVGELLTNARNQYSRLKQLARLPEASADEKARIEFLAWRVYKELIDMLYYVGSIVKEDTKNPFIASTLGDKIEEDAKLSAKEKEIRKTYKYMTPMAREMLVERLHKEIMKFDDQISKETVVLENKEEEPPLQDK